MKPMLRRHALLLLALSTLAACSSKDDTLKPSPLPDYSRQINIDRLWSADVGQGGGEEAPALVPAVSSEAVYSADLDGRLDARKRRNGRKLWHERTRQPFSAGPVAAYNQVFMGTREGEVLAYAADSGELLWRAQLGGEVLAPPAVNGDAVAVKSADGRITLLDRVGGSVRWIYDGGSSSLALRVASRPLLLDDAVLVGMPTGELLALERSSGQLIWQRRIAEPAGKSELDRLVDVAGDFVVQDNRIYVATYQGRLAALDLHSGQFAWQQPVSTFQPVAVAATRVFAVDVDGRVQAVRSDDGVVLWRSEALLGRRVTGAVPLRGWLLVGDLEGWVHVLRQSDGVPVGRHHVNGLARLWRSEQPLVATPVVDDDTVFALGSDGHLAAFRVKPRRGYTDSEPAAESSPVEPVVQSPAETTP